MDNDKENTREIFPEIPGKTYGLMALVRGRTPLVEKEPEDTEFVWPELFFKELLSILTVVCVVMVISLAFNAPLEEHASPSVTPNPAKAPWYFLGLQEMVSWTNPVVGGVILPGIIVFALMALPYVNRSMAGIGVWFSPERRWANFLFTLFVVTVLATVIVGTFLRGPNWGFYWPWEQWPTH